MSARYVLGVDLGTSGPKVAVADTRGRLLGHGRHVLQLGCLLHPELARQLSAEARAEPGLDLVRHLKWR